MPKPPPRSISGSSTPVSAANAACRPQRPAGGDGEAFGIEDLRADVGVDAGQLERRCGVHRAQGVQGLTGGDREAELLVLVRGGDVLVGVRLDPGGDPDHDPRPLTESAGGDQPADAIDLVEGVRDDPTDAGVQGQLELRVALVVAVQADRPRIDSGPQGHGQLAPGADVDAEPLLGDPAGDRRAQEGLAGVVDVPAGEGRGEVPGPGAQVVLVHHVDRACRPARRSRRPSVPRPSARPRSPC